MVRCGWASIDERGRAAGGAAGDQTGLEVKTGPWYYFRQNCILRFKDREQAKRAAKICEGICNNSRVGYDQNQRTALYDELARVGWNPAKISKPVETDCSAMIAAIVTATGTKVSKNLWTGNLRDALLDTGAFYLYKGAAYCETDRLLKTGDIILNESSHVIMALENGQDVGAPEIRERVKIGQKGLNALIGANLAVDGKRGPATKKVGVEAIQVGLNRSYRLHLAVDGGYGPATKGAVKQHPATKGMTGDYIKAIQCLLYVSGYDPKGIDGSFGPGMLAAVNRFQKDRGLTADGCVGPKTMLRLVS